MKKICLLIATCVLHVGVLLAATKVGKIYYNLNNTTMTASVTYQGSDYTSYSEYSNSITIPSSITYNGQTYAVTSIGKNAFRNCDLTSVTIPTSITRIEDCAFSGCSSLKNVYISDLVAWCNCQMGSSALPPYYALALNNVVVTYLFVPEGITSIDGTFSGCTSITSVEIPNSVTSIGDYAFYGCSSLSSVAIPNSVTSIGETAFYNSSLKSVTIPNSVTSIGESAFGSIEVLDTVIIGSGVTSIGRRAFSLGEYYNIKVIYCSALNPPTLGSDAFYNQPTSLKLYVPAESVNLYKKAAQWNNFVINALPSFTITWRQYDGTTIDLTFVQYGQIPTHEDPIRDASSGYIYTFNGWHPDLAPATADATYTATFTATKRSYTITWLNDDGTAIDQTTVEYGATPTHTNPTKPSTPKYTYTFKGWSPDIVAVTGDASYTAQFDSTLIEYEIHVTPEGGTTEGGTVTIDGDPNYGETVTLTPMPDEGYEFDHWSDGNTDNPRDIVVGGDSTIYPIFVKKQYLIQFVNYDESVLQSGNVEHGVKPQYNGETPTKPANPKYTYTFKGWNAEIVVATEPATYIAQYDSMLIEYEIHVTPEGGNTEGGTVTIDGDPNYGETITLTPVPDEGYVFEQWSDGNTDNPRDIVVGGDSTIYPIFHKCEEIIFHISKTIYRGESYPFGNEVLTAKGTYYDTIPLVNGCDSVVELKLNVVKAPNYTLRVVVNDETMGTVEGTGAYKAGTTVTITATPISNKYVFVRWYNEDEDIDVYENPYTFQLNRNLQLRAVFKKAPRRVPEKK